MELRSVRVRMYQVGHGDCFLLRFSYRDGSVRHVLIDCGTTAADTHEENRRLLPVVQNIAAECGGKLDAVVATHPHRDHIGGFARTKSRMSPGAVIASLRPELVIQPWTENPARRISPEFSRASQRVAVALRRESAALPLSLLQGMRNKTAIRSLLQLGKRRVYVRSGQDCGLQDLLPGVRVHVLGPAETDRRQVSRLSATLDLPHTPKRLLFPKAAQWHPCLAPPQTRWFIDRIHNLRLEQLQALAISLNTHVNNTSVILLFEAGGQTLLFPGDAQSGAWEQALEAQAVRERVRQTTVYKMSHHGSTNGTPPQLADLMRAPKGHQKGTERAQASPIFLLSGRSRSHEFSDFGKVVDTASLRKNGRLYTDIELPCREETVEDQPTLEAA